MYRKQLLCIALIWVVFISTSLNAQQKVKESSEKRQPEWIQTPEPGDIIVKGSGNTIEKAKNMAIDAATDSIMGKAIDYMLHENIYFKSIDIDENTATKIFISSAYYTEIKAGKSNGMYWELLWDKKAKKGSYNYFLKYSLKPEKLSDIAWQIADGRITVKLDTLQEQLDEFKTVDELKKVWQELMFLNPVLTEENKNKVRSDEMMQQVENTFNQIEIAEMSNIPGKLSVTQIFNNRALESSVPPTLKSDCAKLLKTDRTYEKWTVDYSYNKCSSGSPLSLTLEFDNGFNLLSKDFEINPGDERIEVKMSNTDIVIRGNNITFYVSSLYRKKVILERIVFRYNDLNLTDTPMHQVLDGAGLYNITFNLPPGFDNVKINDRVQGELYYKSAETGQEGVYYFYNQRIRRN